MKRYLITVAAIIAVILALALGLKPSPEGMEKEVAEAVSAYSKAHLSPGQKMWAVSSRQTTDWRVAVTSTAKLHAEPGDVRFSCFGAFRVTVCDFPD